MKRDCDGYDRLQFNGVVLQSIKHLPEEARATQFVLSLIKGASIPTDAQVGSVEFAENLKRAWRRRKRQIMPQAIRLRVETFSRKGEEVELVVMIIRFQKRPHKTTQQRTVGVCGTPHGYLWRVGKLLNGSGIIA
jgi:hypothetical protein